MHKVLWYGHTDRVVLKVDDDIRILKSWTTWDSLGRPHGNQEVITGRAQVVGIDIEPKDSITGVRHEITYDSGLVWLPPQDRYFVWKPARFLYDHSNKN